ncbi:hypothetical protein Hanom_Chr02g00095401 [Helianthus anomalus]
MQTANQQRSNPLRNRIKHSFIQPILSPTCSPKYARWMARRSHIPPGLNYSNCTPSHIKFSIT